MSGYSERLWRKGELTSYLQKPFTPADAAFPGPIAFGPREIGANHHLSRLNFPAASLGIDYLDRLEVHMRFPMSVALVGVLLLGRGVVCAQGTLADYQRGQELARTAPRLVVDVPGAANWIGETDHFWYSRSVKGGTEFLLVDASGGDQKAGLRP